MKNSKSQFVNSLIRRFVNSVNSTNHRIIGLSNYQIIKFGILSLVIGISQPAFAERLEEVVTKIQQNYLKTKDFIADFQQITTFKSLNKRERTDGVVYFKKPGKMRWDYHAPSFQKVISDGKKLWIYIPEEEQVMVNDISHALSQSPLSFLLGLGNLRKDFRIAFSPKKNLWLELVPKQVIGNTEKLELSVNKEDYSIETVILHDPMGNITEIRFNNIVRNTEPEESLFSFSPPKGAEIIKPQ